MPEIDGKNSKIKLLSTEINFDENVFGYAKAHQLAHRPVVGVEIDQTSVNPHLPLVPCLRAVAVGRFHRRDVEFFGRQWLGSFHLDSRLFSNAPDLLANIFQTAEVCTCKLHARKGSHLCSSLESFSKPSI
jgi:hypothetical protein